MEEAEGIEDETTYDDGSVVLSANAMDRKWEALRERFSAAASIVTKTEADVAAEQAEREQQGGEEAHGARTGGMEGLRAGGECRVVGRVGTASRHRGCEVGTAPRAVLVRRRANSR